MKLRARGEGGGASYSYRQPSKNRNAEPPTEHAPLKYTLYISPTLKPKKEYFWKGEERRRVLRFFEKRSISNLCSDQRGERTGFPGSRNKYRLSLLFIRPRFIRIGLFFFSLSASWYITRGVSWRFYIPRHVISSSRKSLPVATPPGSDARGQTSSSHIQSCMLPCLQDGIGLSILVRLRRLLILIPSPGGRMPYLINSARPSKALDQLLQRNDLR